MVDFIPHTLVFQLFGASKIMKNLSPKLNDITRQTSVSANFLYSNISPSNLIEEVMMAPEKVEHEYFDQENRSELGDGDLYYSMKSAHQPKMDHSACYFDQDNKTEPQVQPIEVLFPKFNDKSDPVTLSDVKDKI